MTNPLFFQKQMTALQNIISQTIISAIEITFASQKEMNISFFYPDMPFLLCQDDNIYRSVTAFTNHLRRIVTEKNARTIGEHVSSHLLGEAKIWWSGLDEVIQTGLVAHYNGVEAWCQALEKRFLHHAAR